MWGPMSPWFGAPICCGVLPPGTSGKDLILAYLAHSGVSGATYAALEFAGPPIDATSVDERMALCNMAVEAGAKTGIVPADMSRHAYFGTDRRLIEANTEFAAEL